jgi:hypothetical protein
LRANRRKKQNKISKLKKEDGSFTKDEEEMATLTTAFYRNLYMSEGTEDMDQLLNTVPIKVTGDMNDALLKPFSTDEIKSALFQMFVTRSGWLPGTFF